MDSSFGPGIDWIFEKLHPESNTIRYVKDNQILIKPLEEGLSVEFEYVMDEPDRPYLHPKLIFPEVDIFEKEEYIKEYKNKSMLKYIKKDSFTYEVRVESSDLLIGQFIMSDDGFYYFLPISSDGCLWSDYTLIAIGNKLKELNQPWAYQINTELSK